MMGKYLTPVAMLGSEVSCGKHKGTYHIVGGHTAELYYGQYAASTLYSRSSCPCKAHLIPSIGNAWHGAVRDKGAKMAATASPHTVEPEQHAQAAGRQSGNLVRRRRAILPTAFRRKIAE